MNKLNQIPHISQQKPQNKRLRIYKPQEGMVKRTPIEVAESLLKASEPAQRMALTTFPIICRHGLAKISRDKLGQHTGYCSKTMGYAGDELHKIGFLWKINQEFIDGNFTSCEYEVLGPCFSAEVIEVLFTIAKELKILSYFMLFTFKEVLKYIVRNGNFPLLSSLYIYIYLNNNVIPYKKKTFIYKKSKKEELTKHDPPLYIKSLPKCELRSEKSLTKGKTMLVNKQNSQYICNENRASINKEDSRLEEFKRLCYELAASKCNVNPSDAE